MLLLSSAPLKGQSLRAKEIVARCIDLMELHAIQASTIDWERERTRAFTAVSQHSDPDHIGPLVVDLFSALNDHHAAFFLKDSAYRWSPHEPVVNDSIMQEWQRGAGVRAMLLDSVIGYLRIPGMPFQSRVDCDAKAQRLNDSLCSLLDHGIKGLVIDLRLNGGGAMYPMILGVQQLLEKGTIGSFRAKGSSEPWRLTGTSFAIDTLVFATMEPKCTRDATDIPIVMLISPVTGSSAEFFLIAFQGRPNTVRLGSGSAGYTTATQGFPIGEDAFLLLSTAYGADRQGTVYPDAFDPDIPMAGTDSFNDIPHDSKVKAAIVWLRSAITD
ncbi:MAG: S41 family peptidase [Flavobacteriales bacterium]|nr:S41 family peptidase [Flavobacteriales bacterium]